MSRTAAVLKPGNANRRFIFLAVGLGLLGAILVYVAFSRGSGGDGATGIGDLPVVVARQDIPARTAITAAMVEVRYVTEDARSLQSYPDTAAVIGQVTRFPITANEQVLSNKVVSLAPNAPAISRSLSFVVPQGKRGFAVNATQVQQGGGLILPGDYIDIMVLYSVEFARPGSTEKEVADNFLVQTVLQNIEVLAVQQTIVDVVPEATPSATGQRVRNSEAPPEPGAATVTLSLTSEQAQRMYLAEAHGQIRMALRPFGDSDEKPIDFMTELELFPQNLPNPFLR